MTNAESAARRLRARLALEGTSVGDALGQRFFGNSQQVRERIARRELPPAPWRWTDDTLMACSVVETLEQSGGISERRLFASFVVRFEPFRGYGSAARELLWDGRAGRADHRSAARLFGGEGSWGNGAAMRAAPIGAWYADDVDRTAATAERSALVTHTHPEGRAGAVAVAVAAALAARLAADAADPPHAASFLREVTVRTPPGLTREGLGCAAALAPETTPEDAAGELGSGWEVGAHDTVPFALWAAATNLTSFEDAFWTTVAGLGDRDTTCAISCGVVACFVGRDAIPAGWRRAREPLPAWLDSGP